jgi:hypothetical protein
MKKLLCIIAAMTMVVAIQAQESEKSGESGGSRIGVGYQGVFYGGANDHMDAASIRWWMGDTMGLQGIIGQINTDSGIVEQNTLLLAVKGLVNIIENENSSFYVGPKVGIAWIDQTESGGKTVDTQQLVFGVFAGTEYFFQGLPEIGFNFDIGYDFAVGDDDVNNDNGNAYGINVTLGAHYYF